ncbi:MAG: hypothetical protein KGN79_16305 [Acidobacteriota bacterium]|nr:hypothetical protein [Acidobacteriota bacterium]
MSANEYYWIDPVYSDRFYGDGNESYSHREHSRCPITREHLEGSRRVGRLNLHMQHNDRSQWIIWSVAGMVIHQDILEEFEKERFTGYRTEPATVQFKDGVISQEYQEFIVTGWAGIARPESGVKVRQDCPACHWKSYTGIKNTEQLVAWSQWTGEDFFMVWPLPLYIFVTERVADWFKAKKSRRYIVRGPEDRGHLAKTTGFTVGLLSNFMPVDLAVKYGRPLGLE